MPRPTDSRNPGAGWVYRFAAWVAFAIMRLQRWRWDVRDAHHVPVTGGAVIASNHTSFWDFFAVGRAPYLGEGRPLRILAKESLFRVPLFGFAMRRAEHIPVHRGAGMAAFRSAVAALRGGELVLVLPEQTISRSFELLPLRPGAVRMAAEAGVPLIPSVSWGTHRFNTAGRWPRWTWRLPVIVLFGQPLHPTPDDDVDVVLAELRDRMQALLDTARNDYLDGNPPGAWWVPAARDGGAPTVEEAERHLGTQTARWRGQAGRSGSDAR